MTLKKLDVLQYFHCKLRYISQFIAVAKALLTAVSVDVQSFDVSTIYLELENFDCLAAKAAINSDINNAVDLVIYSINLLLPNVKLDPAIYSIFVI